jgi:hypothetical protein
MIRRITRVNDEWTIDSIAGTGTPDPLGGDGPALQVPLYFPFDIERLPGGALLFAQRDDPRVRRVTGAGDVETVATLSAAVLAIATVESGTAFVALETNHIVALVADDDGYIPVGAQPVPVAGNGLDNALEGPADRVPISAPVRMAATPNGDIALALRGYATGVWRLKRVVAP